MSTASIWVRRGRQALLAGSVLVAGASACGTDDVANTPPEAPGPGGGDDTNVGGGLPLGSGDTGFETCASQTLEGERQPVQMYIMFDRSGSMLQDQKWAGATAALTAFFQDDDSAGLGIALRFFPDDAPAAGCNENACNVASCATPLVDLGTLNAQPAHSDPHQAALVAAVQSRQPGGQTPMYAALAGATAWAEVHRTDASETVVVLVTDGEPNGCDESTAAIAGLASDAAAAGVRTFTIGMNGADLGQLDQIAAAGGTDQAFVVGSGTSIHKDLVAAFEDIGTTAPSCTMDVPDASTLNDEIDPDLVNVTFTPSEDATSVTTFPRVTSETACGSEGGWYYDDVAAPTTVTLCPASCDAVKDNKQGRLELVFGCVTVIR
ncbi:MAG: vWA domain-containing protein [Myxococcota bacterium]